MLYGPDMASTGTAEQVYVATRIDSSLAAKLEKRCAEERRPKAFVLAEALRHHLGAEGDREPAETGKAAA